MIAVSVGAGSSAAHATATSTTTGRKSPKDYKQLSVDLPPADDYDGPFMIVEALYSYWPKHPRALGFDGNDVIYWQLETDAPPGWGYGSCGLHRGLFPIRYVELIELVPPDTGDGPQRSSSPWLSSSKRKERRRSFASVESLPTLDDDQQHAESERAPFCIAEEGTLRRRLFAFFEEAESSTLARYWTFVVMVLIGLSVVAIVVESLPELMDSRGELLHEEYWDVFELVITVIFSFEYVARLILTEEPRLAHVLSPLNLIDAASISPFYIKLTTEMFTGDDASDGASDQAWMRVLRVARVFRVLKLSKYSSGLQTFGNAFTQAGPALIVQLFLMCVFMIVCSSAFFVVEHGEWDEEDKVWRRADGEASPFTSIPATFWYTAVTMTTVGYGDVFPISLAGKVIGTITMFVGVLSIAMPVSVVTSNFQEQYYIAKARARDQEGGGKTPAEDFRKRYIELRQIIVKMNVVLASLQRHALAAQELLDPALQHSREAKIIASRLKDHLKASESGALVSAAPTFAPASAPAPALAPASAPAPVPARADSHCAESSTSAASRRPAQKLPPPVRLPPPAVAPRRAQEASSEADEPATPLLAAGAPVNMSRLKRMYGDGEPGRVLYPP